MSAVLLWEGFIGSPQIISSGLGVGGQETHPCASVCWCVCKICIPVFFPQALVIAHCVAFVREGACGLGTPPALSSPETKQSKTESPVAPPESDECWECYTSNLLCLRLPVTPKK